MLSLQVNKVADTMLETFSRIYKWIQRCYNAVFHKGKNNYQQAPLEENVLIDSKGNLTQKGLVLKAQQIQETSTDALSSATKKNTNNRPIASPLHPIANPSQHNQ